MVLLAIGVRCLDWLQTPTVFNDGPVFIEMAGEFLQGNWSAGFSYSFHPLTSLMIAGLGSLGGDLEVAGRLVSVLSGGVATLALFFLVLDQFGRRVATTAALLFAVSPTMVPPGMNVQSDGLHLALVLGSAFSAWRMLSRQSGAWAISALVLCGLAYLTRPEGLVIGVVAGLWLLVDSLRGEIPWRRGLRLAGSLAIGLLIIAGPYVVGMRVSTGEWQLSHKKSVAGMIAQVNQLVTAEIEPPQVSGAAPEAAPARLWAALNENAVDGVRAAHPVLFALALVGVAVSRPDRRTWFALSFVGLLGSVLIALHLDSGYVSRRHWLTAAALMIPFSAIGFLWLADGLGRLSPHLTGKRWLSPVAVGLLAAGLLVQTFLSTVEPGKLARREAAFWVRETMDAPALAAHRAREAYYAGADRFVHLPKRVVDPFTIVEDVRRRGATLLLIDDQRLLGHAVDEFDGVREIHRVLYPTGAVLVLELAPPEP